MEYSAEGLADSAICAVDIKRDNWVSCFGTDLKGGTTDEKSIDIKQSDYLFYIAGAQDSAENLVDSMCVNCCAEVTDEGLVIHKDDVMWGTYRKAVPLNYKLYVDADFEETQIVLMDVTADCGNIRIDQFRLQKGKNNFDLLIEKQVDNLEFVVSNAEENDIIIKDIKLL